MNKPAENKRSPRSAGEALAVAQLYARVATRDFRGARESTEKLEFRYGWRYADFCGEFGGERWEEIATELDELDSERDE